jgi:hypothetical protein
MKRAFARFFARRMQNKLIFSRLLPLHEKTEQFQAPYPTSRPQALLSFGSFIV